MKHKQNLITMPDPKDNNRIEKVNNAEDLKLTSGNDHVTLPQGVSKVAFMNAFQVWGKRGGNDIVDFRAGSFAKLTGVDFYPKSDSKGEILNVYLEKGEKLLVYVDDSVEKRGSRLYFVIVDEKEVMQGGVVIPDDVMHQKTKVFHANVYPKGSDKPRVITAEDISEISKEEKQLYSLALSRLVDDHKKVGINLAALVPPSMKATKPQECCPSETLAANPTYCCPDENVSTKTPPRS